MIKPEYVGKVQKKSKKKLKASVDPEKCWGCGVCIKACEETMALGFKQARPLQHIPAAT